ncbi:MAG: sulfatase [Candidatus Eisenbacteria bacterium]|nr:sulfatase [Candidatus Eisenbacteria bacterium]
MSSLIAHILRGARKGLIAGLVIGVIHAFLLASGGLFAMSGPGMIVASIARYAALFAILSGLFGAGVSLLARLLDRWIPERTPLVMPGLVMLYLYPWVAVFFRERFGIESSATGIAAVGVILVLLCLAVIVLATRVVFHLLHAAPPPSERHREPDLREFPSVFSLCVWAGLAAILYFLPVAFGRPVHPVKAALLEGRLLDPLRERAISTCVNGRRNILVITVNTLRADRLSCYGHFRETSPAIDWLAHNGMRFEHAYCPRPLTGPSIATLFTGLYPSQHGVQRPAAILSDEARTMAEIFSEAGWVTAAFAGNGSLAQELGFQQGFNEYHWSDAPAWERTDQALQWLGANGTGANPWLMWVHYVDPHMPYAPGPPYDEMFGRGPTETNTHQRMLDLYDGEVRCADDQILRLLDWLVASGVHERTIVILAGDHGESLGEHGVFYRHGLDPYEPSARVPLIFYAPAIVPADSACASVTSLADVLPSVLDAAGLPVAPELAGRSLLPLLIGMTDIGPRDFVVVDAGENDEPRGYSRALCRANSKYVQRLTGWGLRPKGMKDILRSYDRCAKGTLGNDEYYDLRIDPRESLNLIRTRQSAARLDRRLLESYFDEIQRNPRPCRVPRVSELSLETRQSLRDMGYIR